MQMIRVINRPLTVNPGMVVKLTAEQYRRRRHLLEPRPVEGYEGEVPNPVPTGYNQAGLAVFDVDLEPDYRAPFNVTAQAQFKIGEILGVEGDLDKRRVVDLEDPETGAAVTIEAIRAGVSGTPAEDLAAEDLEALVEAIGGLVPEDKGHFTRDGKPDAKVLSEITGFRVSAAVRDAAWDAHKAAARAATPGLPRGDDGAGPTAPAA